MHIHLIVFFPLIFLYGCTTVLPVADLRQGMPIENVKKLINTQPTRETKIAPPEGEEGNLVVLEYNVANTPDQAASPHWLLFFENKLVTYGTGDIRSGELSFYDMYYSYLANQGALTHQESEKKNGQK